MKKNNMFGTIPVEIHKNPIKIVKITIIIIINKNISKSIVELSIHSNYLPTD